jgi:hypothetical protein
MSRPVPARTPVEIHHWSQAAMSFHKKLSLPIEPDDRDALWATAALLGIMAFTSIDVSTPEDAWPLASDATQDLEWLNMSDGKVAVWNVTDPLRPDSVFAPIRDEYLHLYGGVTIEKLFGVDGIPQDFVRLCQMNELSCTKNNSYFAAVHSLAPLLQMECNSTGATKFMAFLCRLTPEFKHLLQIKDPRALLIFCHWYAQMRNYPWFVARRARLEGHSICLYLRKYHFKDTLIQDMVSVLESKFDAKELSAV